MHVRVAISQKAAVEFPKKLWWVNQYWNRVRLMWSDLMGTFPTPSVTQCEGVSLGVSIIPLGKTLFPNLYIISGHGSKGWTLSFGSMRMMADIALGNETEVRTNDHGARGGRLPISFNLRHFGFVPRSQIDSGAFCPTRFHPIRGRLNRSWFTTVLFRMNREGSALRIEKWTRSDSFSYLRKALLPRRSRFWSDDAAVPRWGSSATSPSIIRRVISAPTTNVTSLILD